MLVKYLVDKNNRLAIKKRRGYLRPEGSFSIDPDNRLIYWLNEPELWKRKYGLPDKIVFDGNWRLNSNYDLRLEIRQDKTRIKQQALVIRGEIISAGSDSLTFQANSYDKNGLLQLRILRIAGAWQVDDLNRLEFRVTKKDDPDILILEGNWQLSQNQQITYIYEKIRLQTKEKLRQQLLFSGFWKVTAKDQLSYIISRGTDSRFDFRAQIETPNIYPKEGVIKYRLGAGLRLPKGKRPKVVAFYGRWKISRSLGLAFDMEYAKGRIHSLEFGAEVNFSKKDRVIFNLKDNRGDDLGVNVVFTRRFLKKLDAEFYLRLKYYRREYGIDTGIRIPF